MLELLRHNWWLFMLRGLVGVGFGLATLLMPGLTMTLLVAFFGLYALMDGVFALVTAIRNRHETRIWALVLEGVAGVLAGVGAWIWPDITALALLLLIAAWAIVTGVLEIVAAIRLRKEIEGEWLLGLSGLASVVFGALLLVRPAAGALAVVWLIGAYALAFGGLLVGLSIWLRVGGRTRPPRLAHA